MLLPNEMLNEFIHFQSKESANKENLLRCGQQDLETGQQDLETGVDQQLARPRNKVFHFCAHTVKS